MKLLGMSRSGVQRACDEGRLPHIRDENGRRLIKKEDALAFGAERGREPSTSTVVLGPWTTTSDSGSASSRDAKSTSTPSTDLSTSAIDSTSMPSSYPSTSTASSVDPPSNPPSDSTPPRVGADVEYVDQTGVDGAPRKATRRRPPTFAHLPRNILSDPEVETELKALAVAEARCKAEDFRLKCINTQLAADDRRAEFEARRRARQIDVVIATDLTDISGPERELAEVLLSHRLATEPGLLEDSAAQHRAAAVADAIATARAQSAREAEGMRHRAAAPEREHWRAARIGGVLDLLAEGLREEGYPEHTINAVRPSARASLTQAATAALRSDEWALWTAHLGVARALGLTPPPAPTDMSCFFDQISGDGASS